MNDFSEGPLMNDGDQPADVALEADRLEELLEVPPPAQPVVMVQYRNRGVPWSLVATFIVLVPLITILVYQQTVVQTYQRQAANAQYRAQKLESQKAQDEKKPEVAPRPTELLAANTPAVVAPVVISAEAARPKTVQAPASSGVSADVKPDIDRTQKVGEPTPSKVAESSEPRVRSIFPTSLEATNPAPKAEVASAPGPAKGPAAAAARDDGGKAQVAGPPASPAGAGETRHEGDLSGKRDSAAVAVGAPGSPAPPVNQDPDFPQQPAPLPTEEEMRSQLAEEAAMKSAEQADALERRDDELRVRRYENRVRFHDGLREILRQAGREAGRDIDALIKRERGDIDFRVFLKAQSIWRKGRLDVGKRVGQIRSLNVGEAEILILMFEHIYARKGAPGGPRDINEARVRAAKQLLSCAIPSATDGPAGDTAATAPKRRAATADSGR